MTREAGGARGPLRIALVNLRSQNDDWHQIVMVPLGVMYISSALKRAFGSEVDVALFDMTLCPARADTAPLVRAFLQRHRPDVVGLRGFSSHADQFPVVAGLAKKLNPECLVIAGGPHASTGSRGLHAEESIDAVVAGEGEETIVELVGNLLAKRPFRETPGLSWFEGNEVRKSPSRPMIQDLDDIALPDYSLLDLNAYQRQMTMCGFLPEGKFTSIFTSRGCHYRCTYCHDNFGKRVRYRSVDSVIDEIGYLIEEHGVDEFHVIDDIFNADRKRAIGIFNEVVRRGWKIRFAFPNGLRGDIMTEEFVAAAREAGAYHWAIAVETATPRIQKLVKKHNQLDKVVEAIEMSDRHGVFTCTFNMLGFPGETEAEMQATIDLNLESKAHMMAVFAVTPYEGTTLFDETSSAEDGELGSGGYHRFSEEVADPGLSDVPRSRIQELIVDAYARFYFSGDRLQRMMELSSSCHSLVHLALNLEERRWAANYSFDTLPDARAARSLADLNRRARELAPELCSHLPVPGVELAGNGPAINRPVS